MVYTQYGFVTKYTALLFSQSRTWYSRRTLLKTEIRTREAQNDSEACKCKAKELSEQVRES